MLGIMQSDIDDYFQFLRFPSVSAKPQNKKQCLDCANWVQKYLKESGLETIQWETPENPIVFGTKKTEGAKGTLLLYIHYDVQPEEPLDLWNSDPFEPKQVGDKVFARGASDNKGQAFYTMLAVREVIKKHANLPINIKVLVDGNEETGSQGLLAVAVKHKEELKADWVVIVDVEIPEVAKPAVTLGMRGIAVMKVCARSATRDLHSGGYVGLVDNSARALSMAIASMWDTNGKIDVEGFFDGIEKLSSSEEAKLDNPHDFFKKQIVEVKGRTLGSDYRAQNWLLPTLEINGITSGYVGDQVKTIIPAEARAVFSMRLVPGQDPEGVLDAVENHLKKNIAKGIDLTIELRHGAKAYRASVDGSLAMAAQKAYEKALEKPCTLVLAGATIPVGPYLQEIAGGEMIGVGVALSSDEIHAPNEHFDLKRLELGKKMIGALIEELK